MSYPTVTISWCEFSEIVRITSIALAVQADLAGRVLPLTCVRSLLLHMLDSSCSLQFVTVDDVRILRDIGQSNAQSRQCYLPLTLLFSLYRTILQHTDREISEFLLPLGFSD